ncbi:hypothetical protein ID866_11378 [Astraeus odoratus]|nr:hypothetical protein ID866_11378 [Astraeus odoratus]
MSMRKSSMTTGAPAEKSIDWMKVPDEELTTDIDNMDLVEEAEKCQKEEEARHQREAEAEQKQKDEERKQATAAEARKWQHADSEAQASGSWMNASTCIRCAKLWLSCVIPVGIKKRSACGSCMKAKERCKWPEVEMTASRVGTSPRGGEHKKWVKKVADEDEDDKIVILSSWKTKCHLEQIASTAQSSGHKMQWHYLLMEGLVGQQQVLLSKLVKVAGAAGLGRAKEVIRQSEELQELVPEDELEDALGNEPENGAGVEDGTETEGQQSKTKGKGKEKAL